MKTITNLISLEEKLNNGEEILCDVCKKCLMKPFNAQAKHNHLFICDNCGNKIFFEENVTIE